MKQKTFFVNFKGLSLTQIKLTFLEDESPTLSLHQFCFLQNIPGKHP